VKVLIVFPANFPSWPSASLILPILIGAGCPVLLRTSDADVVLQPSLNLCGTPEKTEAGFFWNQASLDPERCLFSLCFPGRVDILEVMKEIGTKLQWLSGPTEDDTESTIREEQLCGNCPNCDLMDVDI